MATEVRLGVLGAAGRLGSRIVQLAAETPGVRVTLAVESAASPWPGQPVAGAKDGLRYQADDIDLSNCDVLVDASLADAVAAHAEAARKAGKPILVATTGLREDSQRALDFAAQQVPVCIAPNLSTGVWVLAHLVSQAAKVLRDYDVEIVETHHRHKKDAPSGTALMLAKTAAAARESDPQAALCLGRSGDTGARPSGTIGVSAVRGGDVVGDHTVLVLGDGERLELTHRAHSRDVLARGALVLAPRLVGRSAGRITVPQLLGLP